MPGHSSARALTRQQVLLVDMCLLLAVAVIWNRPYFPLWARPEMWGIGNAITADQAWLLQTMRDPYTHFDGHPTLVVGDSLVMMHPWEADTVCIPGCPINMMGDKFTARIGQRHYARIVLWAGASDHDAFAGEGDQYVRDMLDLITTAQAYADEVVVIGPMPYMAREWTKATKRGARGTPLPPPVVSAAVSALIPHVPDVLVVDVVPFRTRALREHKYALYFRDGLHLSQVGFQELTAYLAAADCHLSLAPVRTVSLAPPKR